jgi:CRISPR/Cas system-associated exonuclease Cas4 (RecB family)
MRIGFSTLQRALACPESAFSDFGVPPEAITRLASLNSSSAASTGTEIHLLVEKAIADGCEPESFTKILPVKNTEMEVKLVFDVESRSVVRGVKDWDELPRNGLFIAGTADCLGLLTSKTGKVIDWKSGLAVPTASENPQLFAAAAIYARIHDLAEMVLCIAYVDPDSLEVHDSTSYTASREELEEFLTYASVRLLQQGDAEGPVTGSHCTYCPKAVICPAAKQAVDNLMLGNPSGSQYALYAAIQLMSERLKAARATLNHLASETPINLGSGVFYGDTPKKSISVPDGKRALPVLAEMLGEHVMDAVEISATSASIERATKNAGLPKGSVVKALKSKGMYVDVAIGGGVKKYNK